MGQGGKTLIREYCDNDYPASRTLWVELTNHHRLIYGDPTIGGDDPGAGFDRYLEIPERVGSWVAVVDDDLVGLTGLLDHGDSGEVEPVIVTERLRGAGLGRQLLDVVARDGVRRGYQYLAVRPVARNTSAINRFYDAGFRTLGGHIDLTMDLSERRHQWLGGAHLHGLDFSY